MTCEQTRERVGMDLRLKGRRALVTGSSSGIGEGIARMLAEEGCAVVVHGRNRERAKKVAAEIGAAGVALGVLSTDDSAAAVPESALWRGCPLGMSGQRKADEEALV